MLKIRFGAALLSLCLCLGLCRPAYAGEAEPSPKTEAQTEGPDNPAGPYALGDPAPGAALLAAPRAGSVSYPVEGGNLYFDPETGTITDCDESVTSAVIPGEIEGAAVTAIGPSAFSGCSGLTGNLVIPDSVTSIGDAAFYSCSSLASAVIPGGVTLIKNSVFRECSSLASVTIPDSVTTINGHAFQGCSSLASVTIPDGVTFIGSDAFQGCDHLTSVTIPVCVSFIGGNPFSSCRRLTQVTAGSGNPAFISVDGVLFNKTKTSLLCYPAGKQGDSPSIPDGITSIGADACHGCSSLTSVTIPDGVTTIDNYAFQGCSSLTSAAVPDGVTFIGIDAFRECSSLTSAVIPSTVTSISDYTFYGCSGLASVAISEGVTSIGNSAFEYCSGLTSVSIPDGVTSIGNSAFGHCSRLIGVTIPDSVAFIDCDAFRGCSSLAGAAIPDGVKSIEAHTFNGCSSLASVTIPVSVTSIGVHAFAFCGRLTAIRYGGSEAEWETLLGRSPVEIPETAVVYYNGQHPAPTVSVVGSPIQTGSATTVQTDPASLAPLLSALDPGETPQVFAAFASKDGAVSGELDASTGKITFDAALKSGDKLFFLEPVTCIPLAKPVLLQ